MTETNVWPIPRLAVAAEVAPDSPASATLQVSNGKGATATVDPGDGTALIPVALTGGAGSVVHRYAEPGHHVYTVTATAPCPVLYDTWQALADAVPAWAQVPGGLDTWQDATRTSESATTTVAVDVGKATIWARAWAEPYPNVSVSTWIGDPDTVASWQIERRAPWSTGDMNTVIYLTSTHPGGYAIEDREAPLGVQVVYRLTVTYQDGSQFQADSDPVTITGTRGCWLTSTQSGQVMPVTVQAWTTRTRTARQAVLEVVGRPDPVVLSDVHLLPNGQWVIRTHTQAELEALTSVLLASRLVLLRTQPGSSLRTAYAAVGDIDETRLYPGDGAAWERLVTIDIQEVAPIPATAARSSVTWEQVAEQWPTWADLATDQPSWLDLAAWHPVIEP